MDYRNAFDLTGSVAVISGGSRGIGYESAVALGSCGAKAILASRDQSALNTAVKSLAEIGVDAACTVMTYPSDRQVGF
jgi:NAD(P)-dependent dehydrogenase (short-subunit alcohol dehydrogenase family)